MSNSAAVPVPPEAHAAAAPAEKRIEPLLLLLGLIAFACASTWVLPAGRYERVRQEETGRTLVVPGSYHAVVATPVGAWEGLKAITRGLVDAAAVVVYVLLAGAALTVVELTGAMGRLVDRIAWTTRRRPVLIVPAVSVLFAAGGATYGMYDEVIAFLPALCLLTQRARFDALTAVAMSIGTASVAGTFSPIETFKLGIAQPLAEVPLFSGGVFRACVFVPAIVGWVGFVSWHASRVRRARLLAAGEAAAADPEPPAPLTRRDFVVLAMLNGTMGLLVLGAARLGWGLVDFSTAMLGMGLAAGLAGGLGPAGTARGLAEGFRRMAYAAVLVGVARAVLLVLQDGQVLDTLAYTLFSPLSALSREMSAVAMLFAQSLLAVPIPSDSGRAMVTMPIVVPLSDLLQLPRQATVVAYQYGSLAASLMTPTAGSFLAMLAIANVSFGRWFRFMLPAFAGLLLIGAVAIAIGVRTGF